MVTRWDVTKAVRASDLPSPSRLVMLVLADVAEVGTAEIPERFTPSVNVLADETGLSRRTVQRHLADLEAAGWIARYRPDAQAQWRGDRVQYRLAVPAGVTEPPGVSEGHQGGVTETPGVVSQSPMGGVTATPLETDHSDQEQIEEPSSSEPASRSDVERICAHLADRIETNGSKRPKITQRWRNSARLLLDRDHRTVDQALKAIDWCQDDEFWRANILSLPKLREKYDQLRLAAQRPANGRASPGNGLAVPGEHRPSTTDRRFNDAQALKAQFGGTP